MIGWFAPRRVLVTDVLDGAALARHRVRARRGLLSGKTPRLALGAKARVVGGLLRRLVAGARVRVSSRALRRGVGAAALALAAVLALDAGYLHAKAWLAQRLLLQAWAQTQAHGGAHKPWPWADTYPVARLQVPAHGVDQIVLAGDAGRTLAFGPGWAESTARPGAAGTPVISGHRDTHFAFLRELRSGDEIVLQGTQGQARYAVASVRIADTRDETLRVGEDDALLLVTCYPFDAVVPGGPLRYVVRALRTDSRIAAITAR